MRHFFGAVIGTECTKPQEFSGNFPRARVTQCQGPFTVSVRYTSFMWVNGVCLSVSSGRPADLSRRGALGTAARATANEADLRVVGGSRRRLRADLPPLDATRSGGGGAWVLCARRCGAIMRWCLRLVNRRVGS